MGTSGSGGYGRSPSNREALNANLERLAERFPTSPTGNFGKRGNGRSRVIFSDDPTATAESFFATASHGGRKSALPNGRGRIATYDDGSRVVFRPTSSDGSPVVELFLRTPAGGDRTQKVHFERSPGNEK